MPLWTKSRPPDWARDAIATEFGWCDPVTNEVLVSISDLIGAAVASVNEVYQTRNIRQPFYTDSTGNFYDVGSEVPYKLGDTITFNVKYSEPVTITGFPHLTIHFNTQARNITYADGSAHANGILTFPYVVQAGDDCTYGEVHAVSAIELNSGTIKETHGTVTSCSIGGTNTGYTVAPTITFSGGGATVQARASCTINSGSINTVTIINPGVGYTSTPSVAVSAGNAALTAVVTYQDASRVIAAAQMDQLKLISVDSTVPTASSAAPQHDGASGDSIVTDDIITLAVSTSSPVTVVGVPTVALTVGVETRSLVYDPLDPDGTDTLLIFHYTVVSADLAYAGEVDVASVIVCGSGVTIKDSYGNPMNLAISPDSTSTWEVNSVGEFDTVTIASNAHGTQPVTADVITVSVATTKNAVVVGIPTLILNINGTLRTASYSAGVSTATSLKFLYTVVGEDVATATQFHVDTPVVLGTGKTIKDAAGVSFSPLSFTPPTTTAWAVNDVGAFGAVTIASSAHATQPVTDDVLTISVATTKPVVVTGNPTLPLTFNVTGRVATYNAGVSTSTSMKFLYYTVVAGDVAIATQFVVGSLVTLAGGTIKDSGTVNFSPLSFTPPTTTAWAVNDVGAFGAVTCVSSAHGTQPVTDDVLTISVATTKPVVVTGNPTLELNFNSSIKTATYNAGASSSISMKFLYTVVAGDGATAGQFHIDTPVILPTGADTIKDSGTVNFSPLSFIPTDVSGWTVN